MDTEHPNQEIIDEINKTIRSDPTLNGYTDPEYARLAVFLYELKIKSLDKV